MTASGLSLAATVETWPVAGVFRISRGARTSAEVVVVRISDGRYAGQGEAVPYARYGETTASVLAQIDRACPLVDRDGLAEALPAGAARNAIDCALWDLDAKRSGLDIGGALALPAPSWPLPTCYTLSLDSADAMAAAARKAADKPLLKLKLGGAGDAQRLRAIRNARPDARLVADANEAWTAADLTELLSVAAEVGLEVLEQPLPAGNDAVLATIPHLVPICADESLHTRRDLPKLRALYDAINIKLDKAGGLTEAAALAHEAKAVGLRIMIGCMLSTSLAMAPALRLAGLADWLDLDGPLLLARDRDPGVVYENGRILGAPAALWG